MLNPLTPTQQTRIVNNIVKATKDIDSLNNTAYKFIMLASGFIAHYNRFGFIGHYRDYSLKDDIIANKNNNQWNNFRPGDENFDYYKSKQEVYNRILASI